MVRIKLNEAGLLPASFFYNNLIGEPGNLFEQFITQ
jgi:hypothetical protein